MMMARNFLVMFILIVSFQAKADPEIDFVPTKLQFRKGLDDDVSMRYSQHVYLYIRNDGNAPFSARGPYSVTIAGRQYRGYVYGPDHLGGSLGGPIASGQTGKLFFRLPLNTLRHCQNVIVDIKNIPQYRLYQDPHRNDRKQLRALEMGNRRICLNHFPIPRRPIPRPIPRPHF